MASHVMDESESEHSIAEELSEMEHDSFAEPSEHLEHSLPMEQPSYTDTFPTYSPSAEPTAQRVTLSESHPPEVTETMMSHSGTSPIRTNGSPSGRKSESPKTATSESVTLKKLKKLATTDAERCVCVCVHVFVFHS